MDSFCHKDLEVSQPQSLRCIFLSPHSLHTFQKNGNTHTHTHTHTDAPMRFVHDLQT